MNRKAFYRKVARANRLIQSTYKYYNSPNRVRKGHSVLDLIEQTTYKLYREKSKGLKFFTPRGASDKELARIENALDMVINSPYTTQRGRNKLRKRILGTLEDKFNISKENVDAVLQVFESEAYEKVRELTDGYSEMTVDVVNDMVSEGYSPKQISDKLSSYLKNNNDLTIREWADSVLDGER